MISSFKSLVANRATRKFGGTRVGVADPYISGYHFIYFTTLPPFLASNVNRIDSNINTESDIVNILSAACTGVTPPGGTLSKVEMPALGGLKWNVPGTVDYGNAVTIKFLEYAKTPILNIMHAWVNMIRDYRTGASDPKISGYDNYSNRGYAGSFLYWTTLPDASTVETYALFTGVYPTKDPYDLYGGDIETQNRVDVDIEFNTDFMWREQWVKDKCQTYANLFQQDILNNLDNGSNDF